MKITALNVETISGDAILKVEHRGDEVLFDVSYYGRNSFTGGFDLFEQLNNYWDQLPDEHQNKIFTCYKCMKMIMDDFITSHIGLIDEIGVYAVQLIDLHDFNMFKSWLFQKTSLKIPDNFEEVFNYDVDRQNTPEQTYLRSEYVDLVTLTLIFRTMMPVWGDYISKTRKEHGNFMKEDHSFQILRNSSIHNHPAFMKLAQYIDRTIGADRFNRTAILEEGLSSEDFPEWVLSAVVVRRLCVSDIRGNEPKANVVTSIHKYVEQKARPTQVSLEERIHDKNRDVRRGDSDDVDDKLSSVERYRIKQDFSPGEIAEIAHVLRDSRTIAFKLSINMTDQIYNTCMETCKKLQGQRVMNAQTLLMEWVFKPVVPSKGIQFATYNSMIENIAVLQAVLYARGHKYLSLLASAYAKREDNVISISQMDSVKRIPNELVEELNVYYPFHRRRGGKKTGYKTYSLVLESIDALVTSLSSYVWIATASEEMVVEIMGSPMRRIPIPPDIKIILANFVLELGKRSWK